jgi:hypothetical protein
MRIQYNRSNDGASVLLVTLGICTVLGIVMLSCLSMAKTQAFSVARAQAWNNALVVAEAGIEDGMAEISDQMAFKSWIQPGNNWTALGSGVICKTNVYLTASNYYNVYIYSQANAALAPTANSMHPVIISYGYVPGPISSPTLSRTVRVQCSPITQLVPDGAMVATTTVNFKGFNISTDSYQSTNLALFPGGIWNQANRRDHGDVSTLSTNSGDLVVQNGKVRGSVHTPPNWTATSANIGSGGSVGDNAWVGGGHSGIESGRAKNDSTSVYPDATLPDTGGALWKAVPNQSPVTINGVTYQFVLTSGYWTLDASRLTGSIYAKGTNVVLNLTGGTATIGAGNTITVPNIVDANGNPYSMDLYVSATSFTVSGTGYVNEGGVAKNLQYYGLPSNQSITLGGNASLTAEIYAPEADFSLGGGGSDTYDFSGMCVTKSITMNGHFNFHFDECAKDTLNFKGYTAHSWDELY